MGTVPPDQDDDKDADEDDPRDPLILSRAIASLVGAPSHVTVEVMMECLLVAVGMRAACQSEARLATRGLAIDEQTITDTATVLRTLMMGILRPHGDRALFDRIVRVAHVVETEAEFWDALRGTAEFLMDIVTRWDAVEAHHTPEPAVEAKLWELCSTQLTAYRARLVHPLNATAVLAAIRQAIRYKKAPLTLAVELAALGGFHKSKEAVEKLLDRAAKH